MDTCEAEHLESAQPEVLDEDVCHGPQETGQLIQQKALPVGHVLIGADTALLVQTQLWKYCGVEISLVFTFEILLDIFKMSEVFLSVSSSLSGPITSAISPLLLTSSV